MEKPEALGAAGGLNGESPGVATRGLPRGFRKVEAGTGLPSGVVLFHDSGSSMHPGGVVIRSPASSRSPGGVVVLGSGPNQHLGGVGGHSLGSGTYPDGFNTPSPGTSVSEASSPGSRGAGMYNLGCNQRSGAPCPHPYNSYKDRPRSILKNNSSILMQKSPSEEKKKSQHWDEMNILATYHPIDKDYGFVKVDEPSTPYHRLQDSDEDLSPASSPTVTPEALAERFATMDSFCPKVLQHGDNRSSGSPDDSSKTYSSDFDKRRKAHYDEGKYLKTQKALPLDDDDSSEGSTSVIGSRGVVLDPEPRPAERGWAGGLAKGVKDETGLVARNHITEAKDSSAFGNPSPVLTPSASEQEGDHQRKEFYSKGRYLRSCSHPEFEDADDEQQNSSTSLTWKIEKPISTEVHLLGHRGSPYWDCKTTENSPTMTVTPSQPDPTLSSKDHGSQVVSGWCQWLVTKGLSWRNPGDSEREPGSNQSPPNRNEHRYETLRLRWSQEEETKQWKM